MLSWKGTFSLTLVLLMLNSTLLVMEQADAGPTKASPPTLTSGTVTPSTGYPDTLLNFSVIYRDVDGDAPLFVSLVIVSTSHNMTEIMEVNSTYSTGVKFFYTTCLAAGTYNYYFFTHNVLREYAVNPGNGTHSLTVQPRISGPHLYNATFTPSRPLNTTGVNFSVMYKHTNGSSPRHVLLILHDPSMSPSNQTYHMILSGSNFTSGVTCSKFLMLHAGYFYYKFTAVDQQNVTVNLPSTGMYSLYVASNVSQNSPPVLSGAGMSPSNPHSGQRTTFWVTYSDQNDDAPMGVWLYYHTTNISTPKICVNTSVVPGNYTRGVNCSATINAPSNGTYVYFFSTYDIYGANDSTPIHHFTVGNGTSQPPRDPYLSAGTHSPQHPTVNDTINFTTVYT
ncbi:MAG: hypothetical protein JW939_02840, partial [Candidatus Thermoplasmatota archaeon]|nr:hypothetical protein [Candidatus Thermoplasmatota archaeon]